MQPGPLSSSHCGRWIGAHQWLAELISLTEPKLFHTAGVVKCAWVCRLKVLSAGLLLTLLMHDQGFTDHSFIPALIQVKIKLHEIEMFCYSFLWCCSIKVGVHVQLQVTAKQRPHGPKSLSAVIQKAFAQVSIWGRDEESCWQRGFLRKYPLRWLASHESLLWPEDFADCARKNRG